MERGMLWVIDTERSSAPPPLIPRIAVRFEEVRLESALSLAAAMEFPQSDPVVQRLTTGRRCFAGWLDGQIVTYGWVSQRDEGVGELERTYRMPTGDAYIWNCVTLPAYRRQGLYEALLSFVNRKLLREGVRRIWIGSAIGNEASRRAFTRTSFQPIIALIYVRLMSLSCLWLADQRDAPAHLIADARRMLIAEHERAWGPLVFGYGNGAQSAV
jgi:ribosomal protein S18 acetylase RimI-like enzyme